MRMAMILSCGRAERSQLRKKIERKGRERKKRIEKDGENVPSDDDEADRPVEDLAELG